MEKELFVRAEEVARELGISKARRLRGGKGRRD